MTSAPACFEFLPSLTTPADDYLSDENDFFHDDDSQDDTQTQNNQQMMKIKQITKLTKKLCVRKPAKLNVYLDLDQTLLFATTKKELQSNLHLQRKPIQNFKSMNAQNALHSIRTQNDQNSTPFFPSHENSFDEITIDENFQNLNNITNNHNRSLNNYNESFHNGESFHINVSFNNASLYKNNEISKPNCNSRSRKNFGCQDEFLYDFTLVLPAANYYVFLRPYLHDFLSVLNEKCNIYIFTSAAKDYARAMVQKLGIQKIIKNLYTRENCLSPDSGIFLKDLNQNGAIIERSVLIDDSPAAITPQPDNGILINPFFGDDDGDRELLRVLAMIEKLIFEKDVRIKIRKMKLKARIR
ncbi:hypothetical protein TRFO_21767 [Tritrichomonas foetus]|uniref:Mitochondrial import inner membrane translocase subunit TIM50 n=1 Tax=Tritrichomonas foetus TaxID=1144522 RepID=A0A1J4KD59_9EUKA|nr:hypothetical protein TRFO_21767 [Tritrichomonas foetus]|eukprot:OHT09367.1 hypothetical protein TRFO_21767 [Tritrichomonas foetus]